MTVVDAIVGVVIVSVVGTVVIGIAAWICSKVM
jgi:hypothetical protein